MQVTLSRVGSTGSRSDVAIIRRWLQPLYNRLHGEIPMKAVSPSEVLTQNKFPNTNIWFVSKSNNRKCFLLTGNYQCACMAQWQTKILLVRFQNRDDLSGMWCKQLLPNKCLLLAHVDIPQCTKRDVCYLLINKCCLCVVVVNNVRVECN